MIFLDPTSQQEFMNIVNSGEILNYDMLQLKTEAWRRAVPVD